MSVEQNATSQSAAMEFVDDLNDAIRENPVAAGLIGMGALWILFGGARAPFGSMRDAARNTAGVVGAAGEAAVGGLSSAGSQVADAARQVGDSISSGVHGAASLVRDTLEASRDAAGQTADALKGAVQTSAHSSTEFATSLQRNLSKTLARQPLMLGAIGLAIGAGIASAFPSTKVENAFMGEAGAAAKEKIQEFASSASDLVTTKAKKVLDDVSKEAEARGLTPSAAKDALQGVAEKARTVAGSAQQSVKGRLS